MVLHTLVYRADHSRTVINFKAFLIDTLKPVKEINDYGLGAYKRSR